METPEGRSALAERARQPPCDSLSKGHHRSSELKFFLFEWHCPLDGREDSLIQEEYAVSKGGSWLSDPAQMRTTYRDDDSNWVNDGFKLACSSGEVQQI
ncbi:hypothetical protein ccbrp13_30370 [Ktedonobacteria bacterium brp13]|nr:hypothetical protein ccbrp13_30370 [Ktedonobacteria bacterium brp13]